jgi:hypothetical protein
MPTAKRGQSLVKMNLDYAGKPGGGGGGGLNFHPHILGKLMDILSRGTYAMAEGSKRSLYTDKAHPSSKNMIGSPTGFAKGFAAGLSGKKKTTFSDVLGQGGMKNSAAKGVLGLVLDIGLDPTTYLTLGTGTLAKGALKGGEATVKAVKVAEEAGKLAKIGKAAEEGSKAEHVASTLLRDASGQATKLNPARLAENAAMDAQRARALGEAAAPVGQDLARIGEQGVEKLAPFRYAAPGARGAETLALDAGKVAEGAQAAGRAIETGAARAGAGAASGLADPLTKRVAELRFMGKPIIQSERAYKAGQAVSAGVKGSSIGRLVGDTFKVGHGLDPEVHNLQRISSGVGRQRVDDLAREARDVFAHTSKEEEKAIRAAIQDGTVDTLAPELRDAAKWTQGKLDEMARLESGSQRAGKLSDAKFEDIKHYNWGKEEIFDRAPQNLVAQYDRVIRKDQYRIFENEVMKRFPGESPEIKKALQRSKEIFGVNGEVSARWQSFMNQAQAPWKRWVTSYRPGFHVRNLLGDAFNAHLAGTHPKWFEKAAKMVGVEAGDEAGRTTIKMGDHIFTKPEVERLYRKGGLETSFIETEVTGGHERGLAHTITNFGEKREKYVRMATFMDSMDKGLKRGLSIDRAVEEAAGRVRKYHFDYSELTQAERKLRTFIPFYTYTRKELPVLLEHTLTTPGKMAKVPKITSALSQMMGVPHDPDDPFPGLDAMLPEYLKDQSLFSLPGGRVSAPGIPSDMLSMLSPKGFMEQTASNLTPLIKAPYELATQKRFPSGAPQNDNLIRYLLSQGPYGGLARDSQSSIRERLLNLLTGMGVKKVS